MDWGAAPPSYEYGIASWKGKADKGAALQAAFDLETLDRSRLYSWKKKAQGKKRRFLAAKFRKDSLQHLSCAARSGFAKVLWPRI